MEGQSKMIDDKVGARRLSVNENERLRTLAAYRILDTKAERVFDDFARLAAIICDTPIALISLVDGKRQWFKANHGLETRETSREISFCSHAIRGVEIFEVQDASEDERFATNPLVTGSPNIRFYAGAPLVVSNGLPLGTLCVIDRKARQLNEQQTEALRVLRQAVVSQLELRRALDDLASLEKLIPICAWCRNIKDANGNWVELHDFVVSSRRVSHGMCPACAQVHT